MNKLDEAKVNLKSVLQRLEEVVESKINSIENTSDQDNEKTQELSDLKSKLEGLEKKVSDYEDEINYLRENNFKLQARLGEEQEIASKLKYKNQEASQKVDSVISEVKTYLENQGGLN